MFDFIDKCTLLCGGPAESVPEEAELSLKEHDKNDYAADEETILDPVDPMDVKNYLVAHLSQPMGLLFEENHDDQYGGAFVAEINEGCSAAADGSIRRGDQLVAIGEKRVSGMDFDEVMKLIIGSVEMKTKLSFFRGPAASLYGPSGASLEWLDEFVAERGEEAALIEDSESEASPVPVHHDVLDDVALAAAALNGDAVDETFFTACQTLLDAESHVEKEDFTAKEEESSVAVEDEEDVAAAEDVECKDVVDETFSTANETILDEESHIEKEDVTAKKEESPVAVDDDLVAPEVVDCEESHVEREDVVAKAEETSVAVEDDVVAAECDAEDTTENLVTDDEGDCEVKNEANELASVEDNDENKEDVGCDDIPETETPMLNNAVNKASKDWLDKYLANPEGQIVSNDEVDAVVTVDDPASDLEARCKKAVEVKQAALAVDTSNGTKGILKVSRYSPKGVDDIKAFESDPISTEESIDDDSAASSVWSEPDDYIGDLEDVPVKRGSSLAALGAASTLTANMMLS